MPCTHIGFHEEQIVVGFGVAKFGDPLGRLPISDARVVETGGDDHGRVILCLHLIVGAVGEDVGKALFASDRIAPFLPFARRQREVFVEHGVEHIDEGHMGNDCAVLRRVLIDDRTHQFAACRAA